MGVKGSINCYLIWANLLIGFVIFIHGSSVVSGYTNPDDVTAINNLYIAMNSPAIPGWVSSGGDPCIDAWQGVQCTDSNIISITLNAANLGGNLGDNLGSFSSITTIDLSNNFIGGSIPKNLPVTIQNLFLSDNNFSGSIPSLSALTQLSAMSLNGNHLTGEIPDSFQGLTSLVNLDLSSNSLSGELPSSFESLSSLTSLHMQNNLLTGTLDVLQDLPLRDLNVENNMFNGPIPDKLLSIPNFKKDGNPFNTSVAPSARPPSATTSPPAPPFFVAPSPRQTPGKQPPGTQVPPSKQTPGNHGRRPSPDESNSRSTEKSWTAKKIVLVSIGSVLGFIILLLAFLLFMPKCCRRRRRAGIIPKRHEIAPYTGNRENPRDNGSFVPPVERNDKDSKVAVMMPKEEKQQTGQRRTGLLLKPQNDRDMNVQQMSTIPKQESHEIDLSRFDIDSMRPPAPPSPPPPSPPPPSSPPPPPPSPPPPFHLPFEKVIVEPIVPAEVTTSKKPSAKPRMPLTSVKSYTIASLQQYTNSFSQENLIGGGMLGSVYRAKLPNGKFLAIKKLEKAVISQQKDDEFIEMVNNIDKIRHANVVELMGYCAEHGQRLLVYEYCTNGTLHDALHSDDEDKEKVSWNTRIRMALGAARALEYLHEFCEPPIIHRNFKSSNILLDDELSVRVSDCGLAPLISSGSVSQLSGNLLSAYGYGAPEFESGIYTSMSDVYSFGVVMLELLTGRMSYDSTRHRGEQLLVRWAIPQLHDIDALSRMVDPVLHGQYPAKSLSHFADIIARCVQPDPEFRPPMSEVVQDLIQVIRREASGRSNGD